MANFNFSKRKFSEIETAVASKSSTAPAAGSSTALAAILGISLIQLACQVEANRDSKKPHERKGEDLSYEKLTSQLEDKKQDLYLLAEQDYCALTTDCQALGSEGMTRIPLKLASTLLGIMKLVSPAIDHISGGVKGDYKAGWQLIEGSYQGALAIIKINYSKLPQQERENYLAEIKKLERTKARFEPF